MVLELEQHGARIRAEQHEVGIPGKHGRAAPELLGLPQHEVDLENANQAQAKRRESGAALDCKHQAAAHTHGPRAEHACMHGWVGGWVGATHACMGKGRGHQATDGYQAAQVARRAGRRIAGRRTSRGIAQNGPA